MLPGNPRKVSNHSRDPSVAPAPRRGREGSPTTVSLESLPSSQSGRTTASSPACGSCWEPRPGEVSQGQRAKFPRRR